MWLNRKWRLRWFYSFPIGQMHTWTIHQSKQHVMSVWSEETRADVFLSPVCRHSSLVLVSRHNIVVHGSESLNIVPDNRSKVKVVGNFIKYSHNSRSSFVTAQLEQSFPIFSRLNCSSSPPLCRPGVEWRSSHLHFSSRRRRGPGGPETL